MKPRTYITNASHFNYFNLPPKVPVEAQRFSRYLGAIVYAALSVDSSKESSTLLKCRCRPNRKPCTGYLKVLRQEAPAEIHWFCPKCDENGVIYNWQDG